MYVKCIYMMYVCIYIMYIHNGKESTCNAKGTGDTGSILGSGSFLGGGHDQPPHYSCLQNPMDRGSWQATAHRVTKNRT